MTLSGIQAAASLRAVMRPAPEPGDVPGGAQPGGSAPARSPRALSGRAALAGARPVIPAGVGEGRDEAVALAGDGGDEARVAVVVLELDAQAADVAVDDVALGHEVGAPDRVEDLLPRHDLPAPAREQVEQALLDAREVDDRVPRGALPVEDVDLDLAEPDHGDERAVGPRRPAGDPDRAGP